VCRNVTGVYSFTASLPLGMCKNVTGVNLKAKQVETEGQTSRDSSLGTLRRLQLAYEDSPESTKTGRLLLSYWSASFRSTLDSASYFSVCGFVYSCGGFCLL